MSINVDDENELVCLPNSPLQSTDSPSQRLPGILECYIYDLKKLKDDLKKLKNFPLFSKVAKNILGIPVTSANIERFFSKTGYILRQHRRRMNNKLAEQLFFNKENYEFMSLD